MMGTTIPLNMRGDTKLGCLIGVVIMAIVLGAIALIFILIPWGGW